MTSNAAVSLASQLNRSGSARPKNSNSTPFVLPAGVELWMLILTQFDPTQRQFSTQEIAGVLGITSDMVSIHCRRLWPREDGDPREVRTLGFADLVWLVRHFCREGRKRPDARSLYSKLRAGKRISEQFPRDCPAVCQGKRIVEAKRRSLLSGK